MINLESLIICESGIERGLGHFKRSSEICKMLNHNFLGNSRILNLSNQENQFDESNEMLLQKSYSDNDIYELISRANLHLVVIDLDFENTLFDYNSLINFMKKLNIKIIIIDGFISNFDMVDLFFIPAFRETLDSNLIQNKKVVCGEDCFLINERHFRKEKIWKGGKRILVLSGGSDYQKIGSIMPKHLNSRLPLSSEIDWIIGPFSLEPNFDFDKRIKFNIHRSPPDLVSLMDNADFAITIFGISFFELMANGIPTVVFSHDNNRDSLELEIIKKNKLALIANDCIHAIEQINKLLSDKNLAFDLSKKSRHIINKPGTLRLKSEIKKLFIT